MACLNKKQLVAAIVATLTEELEIAVQAHQKTQGAATHEESKAENDKDTRAIESSYLARGQARRVIELGDAVASLSSLVLRDFGDGQGVAVSALVELDDGTSSRWYFLALAGGGVRLDWQGRQVSVLTPQSPLGRSLLGQTEGDVVEVRSPQGSRELSVLAVH